jgi:secondary thiamine-phosphate synthase enzyme
LTIFQPVGGTVAFAAETLTIETPGAPEFVDLTPDVERVVAASGARCGQVTVFSRHTTAAIKINEAEPLLLDDMRDFLSRVAPPEASYRHNDFSVRTVNMCEGECANGHAHCQHLLLSTSETIPIVDGRLALGIWQRVFLLELDRARPRQVIVQVVGER